MPLLLVRLLDFSRAGRTAREGQLWFFRIVRNSSNTRRGPDLEISPRPSGLTRRSTRPAASKLRTIATTGAHLAGEPQHNSPCSWISNRNRVA